MPTAKKHIANVQADVMKKYGNFVKVVFDGDNAGEGDFEIQVDESFAARVDEVKKFVVASLKRHGGTGIVIGG